MGDWVAGNEPRVIQLERIYIALNLPISLQNAIYCDVHNMLTLIQPTFSIKKDKCSRNGWLSHRKFYISLFF